MMRWNSTKTYTEDDILRMQQEAVNRVHEFQTRARSIPFYDVPDSAITPYQGPAPWSEGAPLSAPLSAPSSGPSGIEPVSTTNYPEMETSAFYGPAQDTETVLEGEARDITPPEQQLQQAAQPMPPRPTDPLSTILSGLNIDNETLLILGLMFLLYNEKADNFLLMALAYLLL